jgi:phosphatidylserine/phosphatidylglycerophosphate/cardiolipin synthase-like enzyme
LGALLNADEAGRVAAELARTGQAHLAAKRAVTEHRTSVRALISKLIEERGGVDSAAAVLDGIASVPRTPRPDLVWTSPSVPGLEGRTTLAVAEMMNEAQNSIYAATYSASWGSAYVATLAHALERGVKVTLVVDKKTQDLTAKKLKAQLPGARMWTLAEKDEDVYAVQHAKIVMVDSLTALVTSANFSEAGADRNLECGLLVRDSLVAARIKDHLDQLRTHEILVPYEATT